MRSRFIPILVVPFCVCALFIDRDTLADTLDKDKSARLLQGANALSVYQATSQEPSGPVHNISAYMAPFVGAIKMALQAGFSTVELKPVHDQVKAAALADTTFTINHTTPQQQTDFVFTIMKDAVTGNAWAGILDVVRLNIQAYQNATGADLSRSKVVGKLQPQNFQIQINNYYFTQMSDAYDIASSNQYFAQSFDQIFEGDFAVSITDDATTVLNKNLNLPAYFRTHANPDGSLSVDVDGLKMVYGNQSQVLTDRSSQILNLAQIVDQAQRSRLLSSASLQEILQSVPADAKQQLQEQYQSNKQAIADATAGINLASQLAGFFDPAIARQMNVFGNATVQFASAVNDFANGMLDDAASITTASNVAGAALAVYNLLQDGPSQDVIIQQQLAALGERIDELRNQMNERFDIVDAKLNAIYAAINTNFNVIIPNLANIVQQLSDLRAELNRFERNFYDLEIAGFVANLDAGVTGCIAFRDIHGRNMTYQQYSSQTGCENTFYVWATQNASTLATIPGNRAFDDNSVYKELSQPVSNPDLNFFVDSANINYLSQYPAQRFGLSPLSFAALPNPSVWEISAQAHLQLARENPAYDATLSASRLADIISTGLSVQQALKQVTALVAAQHPLFTGLLGNYSAKVAGLTTQLTTVEGNYSNGISQEVINTKLNSTMNGCGGQSVNLTPPSNSFSAVQRDFLIGDYLNEIGRSGFGPVTFCVDLGLLPIGGDLGGNLWLNHLAVFVNVFYKGTEVSSNRLETPIGIYSIGPGNFTPTDKAFWFAQLPLYWGPYPGFPNVGNFKAHFEGEAVSVYPCHRVGDVVVCDPNYNPPVVQFGRDAVYQQNLYCTIIDDFSNGTTAVWWSKAHQRSWPGRKQHWKS